MRGNDAHYRYSSYRMPNSAAIRPAPRAASIKLRMTARRPQNAAIGRDKAPEPISPRPLHQRRVAPPISCQRTCVRCGWRRFPCGTSGAAGSRPWSGTAASFQTRAPRRPMQTAAVSAAATEELFVASAGKGKIVQERLVEILFEGTAPDQHVPGAVDHRHRSGRIACRRIERRSSPANDRESSKTGNTGPPTISTSYCSATLIISVSQFGSGYSSSSSTAT